MITSLSLRNFKSWRELPNIRMAPITGFFGANSSGKTGILQLLLMLKQTAESPDRAQVLNLGDDRSGVSLGSLPDVLYRGEQSRTLEWQLSWSLPKPYSVPDPDKRGASLFSDNKLSFGCEAGISGSGRVVVKNLWYSFSGHDFRMHMKTEGKYTLEPTAKRGAKRSTEFAFKRTVGRAWDLPAPLKCYGFPDQAKAYYQNAGFLSDFALHFETLAARVYYLGPLRDYPHRQYTWAGERPVDMGLRGEKAVDGLLASGRATETIGRGGKSYSLQEYVAFWLKKLGLIHDFSVKEIATNLYRVAVQTTPGAAKVLITDVGFGVSQVLPVIVLCFYAPKGSTILLEQPEIHLHPSVQSGLADVFIDAAKKRKVQIIVESHSEHLLRRIQRRIAEEELSKDEAALYFCEISDGESQIRELELDLLGNITNWPKDFFADQFGEIAETQRAQLKRQQKGRA